MSLKTFHIVFISCSTLLTVGFGYWAFSNYRQNHDPNYLITTAASAVFAAALVIYGVLFLKKLKKIEQGA